MHVFAGARVIQRTLPQTDRLEHGARRFVPLGDRSHAHGIEPLSDLAARECADRHRRIWRAKRRRADLRDSAAGDLAEQAERDDVAGLALIDAHAGGGVALRMLDRYVTFARGESEVERR